MPTLELVHCQLHKRAAPRTAEWISFSAVVKKLYSSALLYMHKNMYIYSRQICKIFLTIPASSIQRLATFWDGCRVNLDDQNAS